MALRPSDVSPQHSHGGLVRTDPQAVRGHVNFTEQIYQTGKEGQHRAGKEQPDQYRKIGRKKGTHEEGDDHRADQERAQGAQADRGVDPSGSC